MFDIGASELLVIVIVAVLVIGPKDLPLALRTAGRWIGKIRRVSTHFRTGLDAMVREAEMDDMEKKWKDQNAKIMAENLGNASAEGAAKAAGAEMTPLNEPVKGAPDTAGHEDPDPMPMVAKTDGSKLTSDSEEPQLPLSKPEAQ